MTTREPTLAPLPWLRSSTGAVFLASALVALSLTPSSGRAQAPAALDPELAPHAPEIGPDASPFRLELTAAPLYLVELGDGGGRHAGIELTLGGSVRIDPQWSIVFRGRGALAFDLRSPANETRPGGGGSLYFLGASDSDMRFPVGAEVGARFDHRVALGRDFTLVLAAELTGSGTAYLNAYEDVAASGGLGAGTRLSLDFVRRERFGFGIFAGGRAEIDLTTARPWLVATGGIRFSFGF